MAELPFPWNLYEEKQRQLARFNHITDLTWGIESALDKLLVAIESDNVSTTETDVQNDFQKNISTRMWTERNRARLRRKYLPPVPELDFQSQHHPAAFSQSDVQRGLHARIRLAEVRESVTQADWRLVIRASAGFSCDEIAKTFGLSAGNVRTKLSRLRARLRTAAA